LARFESFFDDRVSAFANDNDLVFWGLHDDGHPLASGIKLYDVKELVPALAVPRLTHHIVVFIARVKGEAQVSGAIDEGKLIGGGSIVYYVIQALLCLFCVSNDCMAQA